MAFQDIIVVGASAGGVEALQQIVRHLPADFPAAIFVVSHFPATGISELPGILSRAGKLPAHHAVDSEPIVHGKIYIAPPGLHLLLKRGVVRLSKGARS